MQSHQIGSDPKSKIKKRVGRGGKRGTTSGRGTKGQKARSGRRIRPQYRDTLKKIPKKKGYRVYVVQSQVASVNLRDLERNFESGAEISPKTLFEKGLVRRISGRIPEVKILGEGNISKSFVIKECAFSKSAEEALKKSGSRILAKK
jgi:large subunit ribosomal protein L15